MQDVCINTPSPTHIVLPPWHAHIESQVLWQQSSRCKFKTQQKENRGLFQWYYMLSEKTPPHPRPGFLSPLSNTTSPRSCSSRYNKWSRVVSVVRSRPSRGGSREGSKNFCFPILSPLPLEHQWEINISSRPGRGSCGWEKESFFRRMWCGRLQGWVWTQLHLGGHQCQGAKWAEKARWPSEGLLWEEEECSGNEHPERPRFTLSLSG